MPGRGRPPKRKFSTTSNSSSETSTANRLKIVPKNQKIFAHICHSDVKIPSLDVSNLQNGDLNGRNPEHNEDREREIIFKIGEEQIKTKFVVFETFMRNRPQIRLMWERELKECEELGKLELF